jgi:hypothetical protein
MYNVYKPFAKMLLTGAAVLPLLGTLAQTAQGQYLPDGLKAYWRMEDNFNDSSLSATYGGTGSGTEPIAFEAGKFGQAVKLDGNDQKITVTGGEPGDLSFAGGSMTLSAWFRVDAFDTEWQALAAQGENNNWRIHRSALTQNFAYQGGNGDITASAAASDAGWHHIVAISDKENGTKLYQDGVLVASSATAANLTTNGKRVIIGDNPDALAREFEGAIDDLALWSRALTEEEVMAIYNGGEGKEIESFFTVRAEILGVGAAALLGGDVTDPDGNGLDALGGATDPSWNWVGITASIEGDFEGGENAFNIFDNKVGGGNDKWCCDDPKPDAPVWVAVQLANPISLTHFTMTTGNDTPDRDPTDWAIQGSNDGENYEDIVHYTVDIPSPWTTTRNQVFKFTLGRPSAPYTYLRYIAYETPGTLHQLNEIEYFGRSGGASIPVISRATASRTEIFLGIRDGLDTTLVDNSVAVKIDGASVSVTKSRTADVLSLTYDNVAKYVPDSLHAYEVTGFDSAGNQLNFTGEVRIPVPWFPEANLNGPEPVDGAWALRYIFAAGTIDSIPSALAAINGAGTEEFTGKFVDVNTPVANYPAAGGFFGNGLPYDEAATAEGCCVDDFIQLFIGNIVIPADGEYTFGVHSDDGFAMRIRGGKAVAVSGNGELDRADTEAVVHPANTGDSNTRGTYSLKAGTYRIEFFWWERGGGDHGELYAAPGRWANDGDTDAWKLIGDPTPADTYIQLGVDNDGWTVVSSDPSAGDVAENAINNWAAGFADLDATAGEPVKTDIGSWGDPDTNGGIPAFPKNTPGVDDNDYAIRATAKLVIPQDGTYSLGFNSDDGAYMKIPGQVFSEITVNGTGTSVISEDGSTVTCDCLTGDSNTRATITLAKGTYDIEAGMFERGGGAFLTVRGAQADAPRLPVLVKNGVGTFTTGQALQLTATIGTVRPAISVVRNANGSLTVTWEGELHVATSVNGPYTKLEGAVSPLTLAPNQAAQFARAVKP